MYFTALLFSVDVWAGKQLNATLRLYSPAADIFKKTSGVNRDLVFLNFSFYSVDLNVDSLLHADSVKRVVPLNYYVTLPVPVGQKRNC